MGAREDSQNPKGFPTTLCDFCGKDHPTNICRRRMGACLKCGELGHFIQDCLHMGDKPASSAGSVRYPASSQPVLFSSSR